MHAKLYSIQYFDYEKIKDFDQNDPMFNFNLRAYIGPMNMDGEESFDFQCCSPAWLSHILGTETSFIMGRGLIIMNKFSEEELFSIISSLCLNIQGETWHEIGDKLNRFGLWEFEDYKQKS